MPCTEGGTPVTMELLLTLVKLGMAPRANPRYPSRAMRCRFGIRPWERATSRYSSADPSRQSTAIRREGTE